MVSSGFSENKGLGGVLILAGSKNLVYSPWNDHDPEMIPNAEMIPKSTPKWSPINSWNGIVFRHGIITSLFSSVYVLESHLRFPYSLCDF